VRVIGGTARGRRIAAPRLPELRPTSDRVREAIFDVLASLDAVEGAEVVDLFAGSGALGIEALSRGAAAVTFVESERAAVAAIEANLAALGFGAQRPGVAARAQAAGVPSPAVVVRAEAVAWCAAARRRFDLALCDPPYRFEGWPALLEHLPADLAVLESSRPVPPSAGFVSRRSYRYGTTLVTVVARGDALPEAGS
jgi:16S rRNA (guanine966-N2)-methyltransferase